MNNARILGLVTVSGTIEPGQRAGLAVLPQGLLSIALVAVRDTRALMTRLGRREVYGEKDYPGQGSEGPARSAPQEVLAQ